MREGTEIVTVDMGEYEDMEVAKQVGEILETTYPGYLWMVSKASCDIVVKNAALGKFGHYGFIICLQKVISPTDLRAKTMRAGGELLERCGLPRDRRKWDGEIPKHMDGTDPARRRWWDSGDVIQ